MEQPASSSTAVSELQEENRGLRDRVLALERHHMLGVLKISGRGVPKLHRSENLPVMVRDMAYHHLHIRINASEIDWVKRANTALHSPILVKFGNTHTSSVIFRILNPKIRGHMAKAKVFWSRYQTEVDRKMFRICTEMRNAEMVATVLINKDHCTSIQVQREGKCIPIRSSHEILRLFNGNPKVKEIVEKHEKQPKANEEATLAKSVADINIVGNK